MLRIFFRTYILWWTLYSPRVNNPIFCQYQATGIPWLIYMIYLYLLRNFIFTFEKHVSVSATIHFTSIMFRFNMLSLTSLSLVMYVLEVVCPIRCLFYSMCPLRPAICKLSAPLKAVQMKHYTKVICRSVLRLFTFPDRLPTITHIGIMWIPLKGNTI